MINENQVKKVVIILFWVYAALMAWLMIFQRIPWHSLEIRFDNYKTEFLGRLNLVPFQTIARFLGLFQSGWNTAAFVNLVGNVLLFLPLGAFLPYVTRRAQRFFGCLLTAFLIILFAEILQAMTLLGYFDVDDFILNLLGVSLGFFIQAAIKKHFSS